MNSSSRGKSLIEAGVSVGINVYVLWGGRSTVYAIITSAAIVHLSIPQLKAHRSQEFLDEWWQVYMEMHISA